MARYTRKNVCEMCGVSQAAISTNISRGNIIMDDDWIDDSNETNAKTLARWVERYEAKKKAGQVKPSPPKQKKTRGKRKATPSAELKAPPASGEVVDPDALEHGSERDGSVTLDNKKKIAEIAYKIRQTELSELKAAKMRGENIPTQLAMNVVSVLGHSMQSSYRNSAEQFMIELAAEAKLPPELEAKYRGKLIDAVNKAHANAITGAKTAIKTIIADATDGVEIEE